MIRFFQFGRYTAYPVQHDWWYLVKIYHGWVFMQNHFEESNGPQKHTERWLTFVLQRICLTRQYSALLRRLGWLVYSAILVFLLIFWKIQKVQLKQIRRVSHTWRAVSGVRQCPTWNSWQDLEGLLILSLPLIYCARHAPHGPTEVQTFCPPLWSFAQRFALYVFCKTFIHCLLLTAQVACS